MTCLPSASLSQPSTLFSCPACPGPPCCSAARPPCPPPARPMPRFPLKPTLALCVTKLLLCRPLPWPTLSLCILVLHAQGAPSIVQSQLLPRSTGPSSVPPAWSVVRVLSGWPTIALFSFWAHTLLFHTVPTEAQVTCTQQPQQDPTASTASRSLIEAMMAPFRLRHAIEAPLSLPVALSSASIRSLLIHRP